MGMKPAGDSRRNLKLTVAYDAPAPAGERPVEFPPQELLVGPGPEGNGQHTFNRAHCTVEGQFAYHDELLDVGMIHPQHGHVGPASCPALGDLAERDIVHAQKPHRPRGHPGAGGDRVPLGPQPRKREPVAAAGLLDQGRIAQSLEDAIGPAPHIVGDGKDEAGSQLSQRRARAGEGRRVGEETQGSQRRLLPTRNGEYSLP